jgi:predicted DNA-binding protein
MNEPNDAKKAKGGGSSRHRTSIYGNRLAITLRMGRELDERMMAYCDSVPMPANTYVNGLITAALARADPATASLKQANVRADAKVTVSIRLDPDLRHRLTAYSKSTSPSVSVNSFVCGVVLKDLNQKRRDSAN